VHPETKKKKSIGILTFLDRAGKWIILIVISWLLEHEALPILVDIYKNTVDTHDDVAALTKKVDKITERDSIFFSNQKEKDLLMQKAIDVNYEQTKANVEATRDNTSTIGMIQSRLDKYNLIP
jgi:hypothetical protein